MGKRNRERRERRRKQRWRLIFPAWDGPSDDPENEAPPHAVAFVRLHASLAVGSQRGGSSIESAADRDVAVELARGFRELSFRDKQGNTRLQNEGGEFEVSNTAWEMLKTQWGAYCKMMSPIEALDRLDVDEFLDPEQFDEEFGGVISVLPPTDDSVDEDDENDDIAEAGSG